MEITNIPERPGLALEFLPRLSLRLAPSMYLLKPVT